YGLRDLFIGVPAKLGAGGVEQVMELSLDPAEKEALHHSAKVVKEGIASLKL
ncbi:MAG: malate dehydrogenase, partial [Candidatus Omnitrophica bacterium]|nr:malate dehydrogenase [Candidatus Omnitrophota bacterium]